jgi:hypothetical protein
MWFACAGEEINVGTEQDNYLAFEARVVTGSGGALQGTLVTYWPGLPGAGMGAGCSAGVAWPILDTVVVLGTGPVNAGSVSITVSWPQGHAHLTGAFTYRVLEGDL